MHPIGTVKEALGGLDYNTTVLRNHLLFTLRNKFEEVFLHDSRFVVCKKPLDQDTEKQLVIVYVRKAPSITDAKDFIDNTFDLTRDMTGHFERIMVCQRVADNTKLFMALKYIDLIWQDQNTKEWKVNILERK